MTSRRLDAATPFILLAGGVLVPFVGWLVGIVLLWASHAWALRDKLIGTLIIPGGLMLPVYLLAVAVRASSRKGCTPARPTENDLYVICRTGVNGWLWPLIVGLFLVPLLTAAHLIRRARADSAMPAQTQ